MSEEHRYRLTYHIEPHPHGVTKTEVPEGDAATDALFITSILHLEHGGISFGLASLDGRTGDGLDDLDLFQVWAFLARKLSESTELPESHRVVCDETFERVRAIMLANVARKTEKPS